MKHTLLHLTIKSGSLPQVEQQLREGTTLLHEKDGKGDTPLHFAVKLQHLGIVKALLAAGAAVNTRNDDGETPLYTASKLNAPEIVKTLLHAGAKPKIAKKNRTPLEVAIANNFYSIVNEILPFTNRRDSRFLHFAAEHANTSTIELLLKWMDKDIQNNEHATPLHSAVSAGNLAAVQALLKAGANVDALDRYQNTPLHLAIKARALPLQKRIEILQELLFAGANIDAVNQDGNTALNMAASLEQLQVMEFLIDNGADINLPNQGGDTPLHTAAVTGRVAACKILLKHSPLVNATNIFLDTPLHLAAGYGHLDVMCLLHQAKAYMDLKDSLGRSPLCVAIESQQEAVTDQMIETMISIFNMNVNLQNNHGESILFSAVHHARKTNNLNRIKMLVDAGADVNLADNYGNTPLSLVPNDSEISAILLQKETTLASHSENQDTTDVVLDQYRYPVILPGEQFEIGLSSSPSFTDSDASSVASSDEEWEFSEMGSGSEELKEAEALSQWEDMARGQSVKIEKKCLLPFSVNKMLSENPSPMITTKIYSNEPFVKTQLEKQAAEKSQKKMGLTK